MCGWPWPHALYPPGCSAPFCLCGCAYAAPRVKSATLDPHSSQRPAVPLVLLLVGLGAPPQMKQSPKSGTWSSPVTVLMQTRKKILAARDHRRRVQQPGVRTSAGSGGQACFRWPRAPSWWRSWSPWSPTSANTGLPPSSPCSERCAPRNGLSTTRERPAHYYILAQERGCHAVVSTSTPKPAKRMASASLKAARCLRKKPPSLSEPTPM